MTTTSVTSASGSNTTQQTLPTQIPTSIVFLPLHIRKTIFSFNSDGDVQNCLFVSRNWSRRVKRLLKKDFVPTKIWFKDPAMAARYEEAWRRKAWRDLYLISENLSTSWHDRALKDALSTILGQAVNEGGEGREGEGSTVSGLIRLLGTNIEEAAAMSQPDMRSLYDFSEIFKLLNRNGVSFSELPPTVSKNLLLRAFALNNQVAGTLIAEGMDIPENMGEMTVSICKAERFARKHHFYNRFSTIPFLIACRFMEEAKSKASTGGVRAQQLFTDARALYRNIMHDVESPFVGPFLALSEKQSVFNLQH